MEVSFSKNGGRAFLNDKNRDEFDKLKADNERLREELTAINDLVLPLQNSGSEIQFNIIDNISERINNILNNKE